MSGYLLQDSAVSISLLFSDIRFSMKEMYDVGSNSPIVDIRIHCADLEMDVLW